MYKKKILFLVQSKIHSLEYSTTFRKHFVNIKPIYYLDYISENGSLMFYQHLENEFRNGYTNLIIDGDYILNIVNLSKLKSQYNLKIILVAHDDEYLFNFKTIFFSKISDHILTTDIVSVKRLKQLNKKVSFLHPPLERKKNIKKKLKYDVSFVGVIQKPGRLKYLNFLKEKKISLKVFDSSEKRVSFKRMYEIFQSSKINLNFSSISDYDPNLGDFNVMGMKGRVSEVYSAESFCLSEYSYNLSQAFKNAKSIFFKNEKELLQKINYFLKNDFKRKSITKNLSKFVNNNYNSKKLTSRIINILNSIKVNNKHKSPSLFYIDENFLANFFITNIIQAIKLFFKKPFTSIQNFFYIIIFSINLALKIKKFSISIFIIKIIRLFISKLFK